MAKKNKGEKGALVQYADEESRRKAMEEIRLKEKERISIEEENSRLNILKIKNRWRDIMKIAKSEEMKKELLTLQQVQSRKLDRKQATIDHLKTFLNESAEQYSNALQHHLMNIDMLTELQDSRLNTLRSQFDSDVAMLETEFNNERMKIQAKHAKDRSDILGIIARAEQEHDECESDAKHEFSSVKDDVKNKVIKPDLIKNAEEKHALRIQLEGTVEELWKQFQLALSSYNAATEERKKQFEDLKAKDQKNAKEVETQMKRLNKLQKENIASLKTRMSDNNKEFDEKNNVIRTEKDKVQSQFQALKKRMNTFREEERARLTELTLLSNNTIRKLKEQVGKAEVIIKLGEVNQKLETEGENLFPFYEETLLDEIEEPKLSIDLPKEFEGMNQFVKRFNKAYLDKLALDKKHERLTDENSKLKSILKQYLDGISLSEEVLGQLNPLFVVNGKTNAPYRPKKDSKITCVEAQHAFAVLN